MSKFIYKFENYEDYLAVKDTLEIPSISYVKDLEVVINNGLDEVSSEMPEKCPTPVINYADNVINITTSEPNSTIYYTIGEEQPENPTLESSIYTGNIIISGDRYINAMVVKYGKLKSNVAKQFCEYVAPDPSRVITYTTTDGNPIDMSIGATISKYRVGSGYPIIYNEAHVLSNTYENGLGTIVADASIVDLFGFRDKTNLQSIVIPDGVIAISGTQYQAFLGCNHLSEVVLPSTVETIGEKAFYECSSLSNINFPAGITSIGDGAFQDCTALALDIVLPSITYIANYAFHWTGNIKSITISAPAIPTVYNTSTIFDEFDYPIYVPGNLLASYQADEKWASLGNRIQAIPE